MSYRRTKMVEFDRVGNASPPVWPDLVATEFPVRDGVTGQSRKGGAR